MKKKQRQFGDNFGLIVRAFFTSAGVTYICHISMSASLYTVQMKYTSQQYIQSSNNESLKNNTLSCIK